jgi:recombination protein RecA
MARVKPKKEVVEVKVPVRSGGLYFSSPKTDIQFVSSGCTTLDLALGGGFARGRIANIVGDSSTGKTLLAIEASANFVLSEPKAIVRYREAESAFDQAYAAALGFPLDKVDFGEPIETIEDMFEDLQKVVEGAKGPELYIVDSLDALSDRAEMERDIDQGNYGAEKAKKLSQLFRRSVRGLAEKDVTVIIISQVRDNITAMPFAKKHTRSGGKALNFYASQVCWLTQIKKLDRTISNVKRIIGVQVKAVIEKNKIALPYREAVFDINFGYGIRDWNACAEFWKQVTGEIIPKDTPLEDLQKMVTKEWWELENKFLPTDAETKYNRSNTGTD